MIKSIKELHKSQDKIKIDLTGPDGNAYALIAYATRWSKELGLDPIQIRTEMTSGDYENLLAVLEKYFGEYVILYR